MATTSSWIPPTEASSSRQPFGDPVEMQPVAPLQSDRTLPIRTPENQPYGRPPTDPGPSWPLSGPPPSGMPASNSTGVPRGPPPMGPPPTGPPPTGLPPTGFPPPNSTGPPTGPPLTGPPPPNSTGPPGQAMTTNYSQPLARPAPGETPEQAAERRHREVEAETERRHRETQQQTRDGWRNARNTGYIGAGLGATYFFASKAIPQNDASWYNGRPPPPARNTGNGASPGTTTTQPGGRPQPTMNGPPTSTGPDYMQHVTPTGVPPKRDPNALSPEEIKRLGQPPEPEIIVTPTPATQQPPQNTPANPAQQQTDPGKRFVPNPPAQPAQPNVPANPATNPAGPPRRPKRFRA